MGSAPSAISLSVMLTVADENVALINQSYYPNIDIRTAISFPQHIAWAMRKNSSELCSR